MEEQEFQDNIIQVNFEQNFKKVKKKFTFKTFLIKSWMYFLVLFIAVFIYFISPLKYVGNVNIIGNEILDEKSVSDLVGYKKNTVFLTLSTNKWEEILLQNQYVSKVEVKKKFFNNIEIRIVEYVTFGCYIKDNEKYLLYNSGYSENVNSSFKNCDGIDIHGLAKVDDEFITNIINTFNEIDEHTILQMSEIVFNYDEKYPNRLKIFMNSLDSDRRGNTIIADLDLLSEKIKTYDTQLEGIRQTYGLNVSGILDYTSISNQVLFTKYE